MNTMNNKLYELHLEIAKNNTVLFKNKRELIASKSAEITEQIAIEFGDWIADNWSPNGKLGCWDSNELNSSREPKYLIDSTEKLFQEFLKTKV
jgi:hypothetical protein